MTRSDLKSQSLGQITLMLQRQETLSQTAPGQFAVNLLSSSVTAGNSSV